MDELRNHKKSKFAPDLTNNEVKDYTNTPYYADKTRIKTANFNSMPGFIESEFSACSFEAD